MKYNLISITKSISNILNQTSCVVHGLMSCFRSRGIFLKKTKDCCILFLGCIVRTKMVVGSPEIVADTSYDAINMAPVKSLI